ncbi:DDE Tnp4 domain-containing protein [Trichonephila clavipes]|nr:DDE Tnp4 domain-containing protein [Trichonephila clavipes]
MDIVPKMTAFLDKQAQLPIEDANETPRLNNIEDDNVIAQRMLDLVKKLNYLQQTVEENGWARKRAIWTSLSDFDLPVFPRLTWKEL